MMQFRSSRLWAAPVVAVLFLVTSGCYDTARRPSPPVVTPVQPLPVAPAYSGPVLLPDGSCSGAATTVAMAIDTGIGECDLVRLKGKAPTDVLIGESGRGGRETQVLYAESTGRELYFFVNNKLDRIVK